MSDVFLYSQTVVFAQLARFKKTNKKSVICGRKKKQLDTDCAHLPIFDVPPINGESAEELIERVVAKFVRLFKNSFGEEFYELHQHRILFAISVNEIECWLLPLYSTDKKTQASTHNCIHKLNQLLTKSKKDTINPARTEAKVYEKLSREFCKTKTLKKTYSQNPSFNYFVEQFLAQINAEA